MKTLLLFSTVLVMTATAATSSAQKTRPQGVRPKAMLVQLPTEQNRIDALAQAHNDRGIEEVKHDAAEVRDRMIRDFSDNFSYCPVYYFMDTDLDKVRAQQFNGVLLNKDLTPAANPVIAPGSKEYLVVNWGRPSVQPNKVKVVKDTSRYYDSGEPFGRGLIVNNYKLQQVNYVVTHEYNEAWLSKKRRKDYYYSSKHYQISYYPLAKELDQKVPLVYE